MGMFKRRKYVEDDYISAPDPKNFKIIRKRQVGENWVSIINYPNATNYEGKKIIVCDFEPIENMTLDHHFSEESGIIARFVPTTEGWHMVLDFASMLDKY